MRSTVSRVLVPALLLFASTASAQQRDLWNEYDGPRRIEVAANGGFFMSTDWSNLVFLESIGALGESQRQVLLRQFSVAPKLGAMGSVTYWKGRYGFRVHGGFVRSCVTTGNRCDGTTTPDQTDLPVTEIALDQYTYGVQGIVGLTEHSPGQWFRPYLIVGAGGVTYNPDQPISSVLPGPLTVTEPAIIGNDQTTVVITDPSTFLFSMDEVGLSTKFALNLGIGTDLRVPLGPGGVGFRFELSDQINQSPLTLRVARIDGGFFANRIEEIEFDRRAVHNWRLSAGIFFEFGLRPEREPREF